MDEARLAEIQGWLQLAVIVLGGLIALVKQWQSTGDQAGKTRLEKIMSMVRPAHRLAQAIAQKTNTKKDDEFLRQLARLLAPFGIKLDDAELEVVRALGSAEHQDYKLLRDGVTVEVPAAPVVPVVPGN